MKTPALPTAPASPSGPLDENLELSIVMPCLNEAETLATCIRKAQSFLSGAGIAGEVVIADNGSSDGSPEIATALGARVVSVEAKGYGSALRGNRKAKAASTRRFVPCLSGFTGTLQGSTSAQFRPCEGLAGGRIPTRSFVEARWCFPK